MKNKKGFKMEKDKYAYVISRKGFKMKREKYINDIKLKKAEAEEDIALILNQLATDTGLKITGVDVELISYPGMLKNSTVVNDITIDLKV